MKYIQKTLLLAEQKKERSIKVKKANSSKKKHAQRAHLLPSVGATQRHLPWTGESEKVLRRQSLQTERVAGNAAKVDTAAEKAISGHGLSQTVATSTESPPNKTEHAGRPLPSQARIAELAAERLKPSAAPLRATAQLLATRQREISVSEFFAKNRHLLGFDNPRKALLTTVKEAVDNSLDACEEAGILPLVIVQIQQRSENRFVVTVEDNGPGIVKAQIPKIFGKLLYGSKFHTLKMSRGQQGIGISAAGLYGQLTTGKPIRITSRIGPSKPAHYYEIHIDTARNTPEVLKEADIEWGSERGTRVEIELEAKYQKGHHSVDEYLKQVALANPHVAIIYHSPEGEDFLYERSTNVLPPEPKTIRPHPYGVELGLLTRMLKDTKAKRLGQFLCTEFSRVTPRVAHEICTKANVSPMTRPGALNPADIEAIYRAISATKIMNPPTNCIWPIGEDLILAGMKKILEAEHFVATTRSPSVYRGNPFLVEAGIAYGGKLPVDAPVQLFRFANRVPLLYQQSACSITESVIDISWRNYGLEQPRGSLPVGPAAIFVHVASVWVPFTSESKEAIADYPEITKEIKLALQECGRKLLTYVRRREHEAYEAKRRSIFELYAGELVESLHHLTGAPKERLARNLAAIAKKRTGMREETPDQHPVQAS